MGQPRFRVDGTVEFLDVAAGTSVTVALRGEGENVADAFGAAICGDEWRECLALPVQAGLDMAAGRFGDGGEVA